MGMIVPDLESIREAPICTPLSFVEEVRSVTSGRISRSSHSYSSTTRVYDAVTPLLRASWSEACP